MGNAPGPLRDDKGRPVNAEQAEQEYRKSLIVAGRPLEGPDYEAGLEEWYGTYHQVTKEEQRANRVGFIAGAVVIGITAFVAVIAAFIGGILAFFIVGGIGLVLALVVNVLASLFATPSKPSA